MTAPAVAPLVIIGIGNAMRRDDGVGLAAIAHLEDTESNSADGAVEFRALDGEPTRLIEAWRGRRRAVVIDAARAGATAGAIHRVEVGVDPLPDWANIASSHSAGLAEAIALARAVDALPDQLIVFGVEPGDLSMGEGLSAEVESAVPPLVQRILDEVAA
ncbi:MAG: hydrogenase maturation protease [Acidimicrobiales bacterium]|nr:hydrogenase maturation protease [Acidimicrobiales bacterium]RZV45219.1 MAG: hydrogenase maturation protease [Acidimicrobiales bacterium]